MEEKLLTIKDLSVEYSTDDDIVRAVNHVSLSLGIGETLGLVGETGAGKTTLALSLMQLLPKVSGRIPNGEILFNGVDLVKTPEDHMRKIRGEKISMIFQDPMTSLNPVLSVGDQIGEVLELHRNMSSEEKQKRIDEITSKIRNENKQLSSQEVFEKLNLNGEYNGLKHSMLRHDVSSSVDKLSKFIVISFSSP